MTVFKRRLNHALLAPLVFLAGVLGLAAIPGAALAAGAGSPVVGHVYLDDNTAPANTVAGFDRHADGTLTPLAGSPFAAGGSGTGSGLASQGAVALADGGRYLLAVDAGSDQISVLRVEPDGALRAVETGPVDSNGSLPVSIAVHDGLVYVANAGSADSNYTGFTLNSGGQLRPLTGSTFSLPPTAQPGDVLFNGPGTKLVGTRVASSQIDSFTVGQDGLLTPAPGSPYGAQGAGPFGSEFRPTNPDQLFVTNAHNGGTAGTVSAFADAADGTLTSIGTSPFPDNQTAPCWLVVNPDGRSLYAINTGSGSVSSYSIASDGSLTLAGSTPLPGGGAGAVDAGITPEGQFLYVNETKTATVAEFAVNGTSLTPLAGSPVALPAGASAAGIGVS